MPLADFPGRRDWGYDGVLPFAPDAAYGTPDELKALVDAAHARGLMVLLDVVYNHFGPEGNYLHAYARSSSTRRTRPVGRGDQLRRRACAHGARLLHPQRALLVEEYHFDGLRLDAVHAIRDDSPPAHRAPRSRARCATARAASATCTSCSRTMPTRHACSSATPRATRGRDRAMERRPPPCRARARSPARPTATTRDYADAPLAQLRARARRRLRVPGRAVGAFAAARRAAKPSATCRRRPSSPSCRPTTRSATARSASALHALAEPGARARRARLPAAVAARADAVHGRGVRRLDAVPVLLRLRRRARSGGARRAARRVRALRGLCRRAARARIPDPNAPATFEASKLRWDERARPHATHADRELLALRQQHWCRAWRPDARRPIGVDVECRAGWRWPRHGARAAARRAPSGRSSTACLRATSRR